MIVRAMDSEYTVSTWANYLPLLILNHFCKLEM
jgi:hypothetical protein